ncbi:MAG: DUF3352 domain-containing protein [Bacteroidia bacterium]
MKKRLAVLVTVLVLLAAMLYEYLHLRKSEVLANTAIIAIPIDASFIFESRKTYPLWNGISQTNLIWKDMLGTESISELDRNIRYLDTLVGEDPKVHAIVESQPIFISAHKNGMEHFDYLFVCAIPNTREEEGLHSYMETLSKKGSITQSQYDGIIEYCLKQPGKNDFYYAVHKGIFIGSLKSELVQESLRQMESGISLMDNTQFTKVFNASSGQPIAQLFINYGTLNNAAVIFMAKDFYPYVSSIQDFAQWTGFDISLAPEEVIMNGFTSVDSSGAQFLSLFNHQSPQETRVPTIIPANTSFMSCFEISDPRTFIKDYRKYMGLHRRAVRHNEWVSQIEKDYGINVEKNFYSWLDNEIALVITEPSDTTLQNDTYAIIGTNNTGEALRELGVMSDTVKGEEAKHFETYKYMDHDIHYISLDNMLPNLLGGTFDAIKKTYYTDIKNYIVFANNAQALELFINKYEGGNTLAKDEYYQSFTREHIENESAIYVYNNVALSPMLYEQYLDKPYADAVKKHSDITKKFQATGIQFNYMQGMYYTNFYFKRNPQYKKQAGALWQIALDTSIAIPPMWVTDKKTKCQFVFTQDKADNIYLIANTGHILWKKEMKERIMGQVYAVDALKNGKSQYLFNTQSDINVVDRTGKSLYGFPIHIPSKASAPLSLFDYEEKRNYRIFVPCGDNKIRVYDIAGKSVKDWKVPETGAEVKCPLIYEKIDGTDYIIAVDDNGKVYTFDRKGKSRLQFKNKLPKHISHFNIAVGKNASETYLFAADSTGIVYQLSLTDYLTRVEYLKDNIRNTDFVPVDLEGNGRTDMVFLTPYNVYAYSPDKTLLFHFSERDSLKSGLLAFTYSDGKGRIGAIDAEKNKLYMWDSQGNICSGFPLYGNTKFSIADMNNDGQLYLVTGASDNNVYVYSLP